jgi:long-chain fatty acid transport protein
LKVAAICGFGAIAAPAMATNGYFVNGYGAPSKSMAGAGVAVPTGVLGLAQNPAMGVKVGNRVGLCLTFFAPDRDVRIAPGGPLTPGRFGSDQELFIIPCGGVNFKLDDRSSLAFFVYANGGLNTDFDTNFFSGLGAGSAPLGVNLEQAFLSTNYARKVSDKVTIGISPVFAVQRFRAEGLEAFSGLSVSPGSLTNRGTDTSTGFGVNLGVLYDHNAEWTFGAAYRSRVNMSKFSKYNGLFADDGDFDIPATLLLGAAYTPARAPQFTFTGEYQRIWYSNIPAIGNPSAPPQGPLGSANGVGFGWRDMDIWRLAAIWRKSDRLTLRTGVSYSSKFIEDGGEVVINTIAPAAPQWHLSVGGAYVLSDRWTFQFSYTHAFSETFSGNNPALTGAPQNVKIRMHQNEISTGLSYRW